VEKGEQVMTVTRDFDFTFTVQVTYTPAIKARPAMDPSSADYSVPGEPADIELSLIGDAIPTWLRNEIETNFEYDTSARDYFLDQLEQS
jgi:hypothetical protein